MSQGQRLVLIDGHALLYRAFFAFPRSLTLADGQMVNAAFGFTRILLSTLVELKPTHIAVSFDVGKTFRHKQYPEYKAHREKMPDELKSQEPIVQEILNDFNVPIYSMLDYEADDVIGTVARQAIEKRENQVIIVTGDRDMWQLVKDEVKVFVPGGGRHESRMIDRQAAFNNLGVWPEEVPDYKGLAGDGSDNIPGVAGIGPKTAVELIRRFGGIEQIYANLDEIRENVKKKLTRHKEMALLSKQLATIKTDVPLVFNLNACKVTAYDKEKATATLLKYGFKSLVAALPVDEFEEKVQEALF